MNKRINIATSSIVALIMLVAMAGVIASGLMQVNQEHNIAVEEQNTTKIIAQYMNSIKTTEIRRSCNYFPATETSGIRRLGDWM